MGGADDDMRRIADEDYQETDLRRNSKEGTNKKIMMYSLEVRVGVRE